MRNWNKANPIVKTPAKPAKVNKHRVNTGDMEQGMTRITGIKSAFPTMPKIIFKPKVWAQMEYIVDKCPKEVGWFTLQTYNADTNIFTVYDLILPEQEVTSVETAISGDDLGKAAYEVIEQGGDTSHIYGWFHSHVNMAVSPSGQDETQVEEFIEDLTDTPEVPAFIRGIINKQGDVKLDVYYMHHGIAYTCVPYEIEQTQEWVAGLDTLIKQRVKEAKPAYSYMNMPYAHAGAAKQRVQSLQHGHSPQHVRPNVLRDPVPAASNAGGFRDYAIEEEDWEVREMNIFNGTNIVDVDAYGYDWDVEDPIQARPDGWWDDEDYQQYGYVHDSPANQKLADANILQESLL